MIDIATLQLWEPESLGLRLTYNFSGRHPGPKVVVLDKEKQVASHQTGHNSGVIHSGLYYKPGSLKARLCVEGERPWFDSATSTGIPHEICGKIIVTTEETSGTHFRGVFSGLLEGGGARLA